MSIGRKTKTWFAAALVIFAASGITSVVYPQAVTQVSEFVQGLKGAVRRTITAKLMQRVDVEDFGAKCDANTSTNPTDDYPAFLAAVNAGPAYGGLEIRVPGRACRLSSTLNIVKPVRLGGTLAYEASTVGSELQFDVDQSGVIINRADTYGYSTVASGTYSTLGAAHTIIENLSIVSKGYASNPNADGIVMRTLATLRNTTVIGFKRDGYRLVADLGGTGDRQGNINTWRMDSVQSYSNGRNGYYIEGCDSNAGVSTHMNGSGNAAWGLDDESCFGNTHNGYHFAGNGTGQYKVGGNSSKTLMSGGYTEGPTPNKSKMQAPAIQIGGLQAAGFTDDSDGCRYDGQSISCPAVTWNNTAPSGSFGTTFSLGTAGFPNNIFTFGSTDDTALGWAMRYNGSGLYYLLGHGLDAQSALGLPGTTLSGRRAWAPIFFNGYVMNGATGALVSGGPIASRPATCTQGDRYEYTDSAAGGFLGAYCVAANTWKTVGAISP